MKRRSTGSSISRTSPEVLQDGETLEGLACGDLVVIQKRTGYRFSLDAYLLAAFVEEEPGTHILEIGSGSGVVSIMLAGIKQLRLTGIEVQAEVAEMSRRAVHANGLGASIEIVTGDVREYAGQKVGAVIANPPYRPVRTGRVNPDREKAVARHELLLDLEGLLAGAARNLAKGGRFYCIYPAWRLADLMSAMRTAGIEPKRLVMVHPAPHHPAELCLLMGVRKGGKELRIEAPFFVRTAQRNYSTAMIRVFETLGMEG